MSFENKSAKSARIIGQEARAVVLLQKEGLSLEAAKTAAELVITLAANAAISVLGGDREVQELLAESDAAVDSALHIQEQVADMAAN